MNDDSHFCVGSTDDSFYYFSMVKTDQVTMRVLAITLLLFGAALLLIGFRDKRIADAVLVNNLTCRVTKATIYDDVCKSSRRGSSSCFPVEWMVVVTAPPQFTNNTSFSITSEPWSTRERARTMMADIPVGTHHKCVLINDEHMYWNYSSDGAYMTTIVISIFSLLAGAYTCMCLACQQSPKLTTPRALIV